MEPPRPDVGVPTTDHRSPPASPATGSGRWARARARAEAVRAHARRTPAGRLAWRIGVGVVGWVVVIVGIVTIPAPGQGWATVFLGLAILSTEFAWARRVRHALWLRLVAVRGFYAARPPRTRAALLAATTVLVVVVLLAVAWGSVALSGVPDWLPSVLAEPLDDLPGVD